MQIGLVGIGAGVAGALLFASVTSASYLSIILFYLAPLPIMIAGLGWSHWSALIGAAAGSLLLVGLFGSVFSLGFLAAVGAPGWWLSHLAMSARPIAADQTTSAPEKSLAWFPPGMLVVWTALIGAALVLISIPMIGLDAAHFHAALVEKLSHVMRIETGTPAGKPLSVPGVDNVDRMLDVLARIIPLWVPFLLIAAVGASFAGGMPAIAAGVVVASLTIAYAVLGFAVLHEITRGLDSRPFVLGGVYASVLIFGWPVLAMSLLGLAETALHLRARVAGKRTGSAKR